MRSIPKSIVLAAAAAHLALTPLAYSSHAFAAGGNLKLPNPYVSRAFDAVLLPVDDSVRAQFKLDAKDAGVLVLAVEPGGVADQQGIAPGDVISQIKGHQVTDPIELDEVVYYWLQKGVYDFVFDYYRGGAVQHGSSTITLALYDAVIDIAVIATWTSVSVESFSYSAFYAEYSEELTTSYESSETTIEETASSEEFSSEVNEESTSAETIGEAAGSTDGSANDAADDGVESAQEAETSDDDGDGIVDAEDTDDDGDGISDADDSDDDGDGVDDADDADEGGDDD